MTYREKLLLRALASLQSGILPEPNSAGDIVVFKEEWDRAFSPQVVALLADYYRDSQRPISDSSQSASVRLTGRQTLI